MEGNGTDPEGVRAGSLTARLPTGKIIYRVYLPKGEMVEEESFTIPPEELKEFIMLDTGTSLSISLGSGGSVEIRNGLWLKVEAMVSLTAPAPSLPPLSGPISPETEQGCDEFFDHYLHQREVVEDLLTKTLEESANRAKQRAEIMEGATKRPTLGVTDTRPGFRR